MKHSIRRSTAGLTLLEVTLVIAVLIALISVLFIGVSAWREGQENAKKKAAEQAAERVESVQP
jgi:type II secretory pathway pseudopilin PulG